jgi:hypothetical protein
MTEGAAERVGQYLGKVIPSLLGILREQNGPYVSPRTYCRNLPETILAVAAFHRVNGSAEPLRRGAVEALRYALATKYQIKPVVLDQIHQSAEGLLSTGELPPSEKIRLEIAAPATFEQRLEYLQANWKAILAALPADEVEKVLGELLRGASKKGDQEKLVVLKHALDELGYKGDALRQVDGRLLIALNAAINAVMPKLAKIADGKSGTQHERALGNIEVFRAMVSAGTFLAANSPPVRELKKWLIDLREGDVPGDDESIYKFFASLDLPKPN